MSRCRIFLDCVLFFRESACQTKMLVLNITTHNKCSNWDCIIGEPESNIGKLETVCMIITSAIWELNWSSRHMMCGWMGAVGLKSHPIMLCLSPLLCSIVVDHCVTCPLVTIMRLVWLHFAEFLDSYIFFLSLCSIQSKKMYNKWINSSAVLIHQ